MTNREILQVNRELNNLYMNNYGKSKNDNNYDIISHIKYTTLLELMLVLNYKTERLEFNGCVSHIITKI